VDRAGKNIELGRIYNNSEQSSTSREIYSQVCLSNFTPTVNMATAVLLIDHYNDFLHPKGKAHPSVKESIDATGTIGNLHKLVKAARNNRIPIFHCMHQQVDAKTFQGWQMLNKSLDRIAKNLLFEKESFGAQYYEGLEPDPENGDVVVSRHWNSR
jgi:nicotinamidase-related amidase